MLKIFYELHNEGELASSSEDELYKIRPEYSHIWQERQE
jgi:hypothetical protein